MFGRLEIPYVLLPVQRPLFRLALNFPGFDPQVDRSIMHCDESVISDVIMEGETCNCAIASKCPIVYKMFFQLFIKGSLTSQQDGGVLLLPERNM